MVVVMYEVYVVSHNNDITMDKTIVLPHIPSHGTEKLHLSNKIITIFVFYFKN